MATKYYLDQEGLERLVDYIQNELGDKVSKGDQISLPNDLVYEADLADYAKKSDIPEGQDLSEYAKTEDLADVVRDADIADVVRTSALADLATKAELEDYVTDDDLEALEAKVTGVYHFKGNVANLEALQQIEDPQEGDVYNIEDTGINAAWVVDENNENGGYWDEFGTQVDLSDYALKEEIQAMSIPTVDSILYGGKRAVVSDASGIAAMLTNEEPEVEIVLNKSISGVSTFTVPEGKSVTLDLGGNTLSGNTVVYANGGEVTLKNGTISSSSAVKADPIQVVNGGKLTLDGAQVIGAKNNGISASGEGSEVVINSGSVTAQEAGIYPASGAKLTINGGTISCIDNGGVMGNGTPGKGNTEIVMNGGRIEGHITSAGYQACAVYLPNSGSFTMNGGEIVSDGAGIVMRGGQVNLNAGSVIANGPAGFVGKVGDSRVVVGSYAIVYDVDSKYPAMDTLELNIADGVVLQGTDGDISILPVNTTANITDNRS